MPVGHIWDRINIVQYTGGRWMRSGHGCRCRAMLGIWVSSDGASCADGRWMRSGRGCRCRARRWNSGFEGFTLMMCGMRVPGGCAVGVGAAAGRDAETQGLKGLL